MHITFLGTGSSLGVPVIGCNCSVCLKKINIRKRCSAILKVGDVQILIDISPDFRQQAFEHSIFYIDLVLCTHEHYDHFSGAPDLVSIKPRFAEKIDVYCSNEHYDYIKLARPYLLNATNLHFVSFDDYSSFVSHDLKIDTLLQFHGNINSTAFVINDTFAYCTDLKYMYEKSLQLLLTKDLDLLVLQCIKIHGDSKTHLNLREAVLFVKKIKVKVVYLTHLSHHIDMDTFQDEIDMMRRELCVNTVIKPAIDGLNIQF